MAEDAKPRDNSGATGHAGHRARLRRRYLHSGPGSLADYEMLELLLAGAIPRRDTKPVAKALLERFGSYAAVLRADAGELQQVDGIREAGAVTLMAVADAAERLARQEIMDRLVLSSWDRLVDYLRISMIHHKTERFRILFLDVKNTLIADEVQQSGTVNHTPVYPREVVKRALELSASALIMVHNHPSGDATPSRADIEMTREVREAAAKLGVALHDHVIVARSGHTSFKSLGLL